MDRATACGLAMTQVGRHCERSAAIQAAVLQTARMSYSKALQEHLIGFAGDTIKFPN